MKVVVQRSKKSSVSVSEKIVNEIDNGMVLLVSFTQGDTIDNILKMTKKIANLRIFDDENGVMNKSILDVGGEILSISQFTLYGDTTKGNRPSYVKALNGEEAIKLYETFNEEMNKYVLTKPGIFGAEMMVNISNDGPVTLIMELKMKKFLNKYKTVFTYLLSSGLSFIVDIISFSIILYFIKDRFLDAILLSSYVARAISSVVNYIVNKKYVFKNEKKRNYKAFIEYFLLVIINITISGLLVTKVYNYIHLNATFIKVIIDSIIFVINYFLQKLVIFKK